MSDKLEIKGFWILFLKKKQRYSEDLWWEFEDHINGGNEEDINETIKEIKAHVKENGHNSFALVNLDDVAGTIPDDFPIDHSKFHW
jgi:hypothetical protein